MFGLKKSRFFKLGFIGFLTVTVTPLALSAYVGTHMYNMNRVYVF